MEWNSFLAKYESFPALGTKRERTVSRGNRWIQQERVFHFLCKKALRQSASGLSCARRKKFKFARFAREEGTVIKENRGSLSFAVMDEIRRESDSGWSFGSFLDFLLKPAFLTVLRDSCGVFSAKTSRTESLFIHSC